MIDPRDQTSSDETAVKQTIEINYDADSDRAWVVINGKEIKGVSSIDLHVGNDEAELILKIASGFVVRMHGNVWRTPR